MPAALGFLARAWSNATPPLATDGPHVGRLFYPLSITHSNCTVHQRVLLINTFEPASPKNEKLPVIVYSGVYICIRTAVVAVLSTGFQDMVHICRPLDI